MPRSLLVGSHFRPPAKLVLAALAAGTPLRLEAEPDNPYDPNAIRVFVSTHDIPPEQHPALAEDLPGFSFDLASVLEQDEIWLGYIAAEGGKPLAERPDLDSNRAFAGVREARLVFGPNGETEVES